MEFYQIGISDIAEITSLQRREHKFRAIPWDLRLLNLYEMPHWPYGWQCLPFAVLLALQSVAAWTAWRHGLLGGHR